MSPKELTKKQLAGKEPIPPGEYFIDSLSALGKEIIDKEVRKIKRMREARDAD